MDPIVAIVVIGLGAYIGSYVAIPLVKGLKKMGSGIKNQADQLKMTKPLTKEELQEEARKRAIKYGHVQTKEIRFEHIQKKGVVENEIVTELAKFDKEKDKLFKAQIIRPNREPEVVYCYQPRAKFNNGVEAGPRYTKTGRLLDKYCYLYKNYNGIHEGYLPKREVVSNVEMDFFDNEHNIDPSLSGFLRMVGSRDQNGNFVPVDLNDPKEALQFETYLHKYATDKVDDISYFETIINQARKAKEDNDKKVEKMTEEFYSRAEAQEAFREEQEKKAQDRANDTSMSSHDYEQRRHEREYANKQRAYDLGVMARQNAYAREAAHMSGGIAPGPMLPPEHMHHDHHHDGDVFRVEAARSFEEEPTIKR